ncbi:CHC2 zinc finger domain-containing protein [Sphingomonas sp. MG17]|uniref:CHC2 zinc finger domain-containing protein n=1 Tax=Sphingomonas tagetis TaxID=2949092 RepID=A0A9X2HI92_9SPHN|nr:CHC2 zinc finger domain-containing protein [Sphingomonas tagetis]MCP3730412.1 CHC2 zinc finger domain-containing protein [Sphingomonas tagetis]
MAGGQLDPRELQDRAARVRERVPISSVISRDVKLRDAGSREKTGLCPFHAEKRDGAFMVNDDKGIFQCFACGKGGDVFDYLKLRLGLSFMDALKELAEGAGIDFSSAAAKPELDGAAERRKRQSRADAAKRRADARDMWLTAHPGLGSPAQLYLEERGIDFAGLGHFPGSIRFRPDCYNGEVKAHLPAMVTSIVSLSGDFMAVHRTWLTQQRGSWIKAPLDKAKMVLGDFYTGSMSIWKGGQRKSLQDVAPGTRIAISEGIEDGLSAAMNAPDLYVRAAVSLDNSGNVALPPQAGDVILICQRDKEDRERRAARCRVLAMESWGEAAEDYLRQAAHHEHCARHIEGALERSIAKHQRGAASDGSGRAVRLAWPSEGYKDFNDELRGVRMEGA